MRIISAAVLFFFLGIAPVAAQTEMREELIRRD